MLATFVENTKIHHASSTTKKSKLMHFLGCTGAPGPPAFWMHLHSFAAPPAAAFRAPPHSVSLWAQKKPWRIVRNAQIWGTGSQLLLGELE